MQTINVQIDISTPAGRRLLREVELHPKVAKVEYPLPEAISETNTFTHEEVFGKLEKKLNEHYGTNFKLKY
jgi:hypothetical protein